MENNNTTSVETETKANDNADLESVKAEIARLKEENEKLRKANTNASADASKYKKELQARMSEQEQADAKRKEEQDTLLAELASLKRDKSVSDYVAQLVATGFDGELAKSSAEAMVDGDFGTFFKGLASFIEAHDKTIVAEAIKKTPKPGATETGANNTVTAEQFKKMSYAERNKLFNENKSLYDELNKS